MANSKMPNERMRRVQSIPGDEDESFEAYTYAFKPVKEEELITFGDRYGLFTPLTKGRGTSNDEVSKENLEEIIDILREDVTHLKFENTRLKEKIKQDAEDRTYTPDDLMTAITHSVDNLQAKLANMSNPISDFAVRQLDLDLKAIVDVSPIGTINYRFLRPEDKIDSGKISHIHLSLSAVPKNENTGSISGSNFTPFIDVEDIQGIGKKYKERLNHMHIYTIKDLLHAGTRMRSKIELASLIEVDRKRLDQWISHASLMLLRDIDAHAAQVLFGCGITGLDKLSETDPEMLIQQYNSWVETKGQNNFLPVSLERVRFWIQSAKEFTGIRHPPFKSREVLNDENNTGSMTI